MASIKAERALLAEQAEQALFNTDARQQRMPWYNSESTNEEVRVDYPWRSSESQNVPRHLLQRVADRLE